MTLPEGDLAEQAPGSRRPGGRTARTQAAVMDAVVGELVEKGYAGASVEAIASRAGVAKTTIYSALGRPGWAAGGSPGPARGTGNTGPGHG